jgi:hypothetical protein
VSFTGVGTCTIDANQAESANYTAAAQAQQPVSVAKGSQTITFTSTPPSNATVGGPTYAVTAVGGGSPNPVVLTIDSASKQVCTISGSTVTFIGAGTCTIDANQSGDKNYEPAMTSTQSFGVLALSQTITFSSSPPSGATVGGAYTVTASGGASGNPVVFTIDPASGSVCTISGSSVSFVGAGVCTIDANQAGNEQYGAASQAQQSFLIAAPAVRPGPAPPGPIVQVKPVVIPDSSFRVLGATLSLATYSITFVESVVDPGTFSWVLTFENGKFGAFAARAKACKSGSVRLTGKCRPARVLFAKGTETVASPGSVTFTVRPTRAGVAALRRAFKLNKGLPVTANVTFQSARGGQPVSRVQSLIVKGRR